MPLVDSHCHLDMLDLSPYNGDLDMVIQNARSKGVVHILNVCVSMNKYAEVLATAKRYPFVSASVGLHPNELDEELSEKELIGYAEDDKVVAIGETGLDYYRSTGDLEWQRERFRNHIRAAKMVGKPLIVHSRAAKEDTLRILEEENAAAVGGVLHCFTEDWDMATRAMDLGLYISFSGIVTFRNAASIQEVAARMPMERMLFETDAPYLAPIPFRGKSNVPAYVLHTAEFIANMRDVDYEQLASVTTDNFFTLFNKAKR